MSQANFTYSIALILACGLMMMAPGLATFSDANGFLPPLFDDDPVVKKCLSTMESVHGCVQEVVTSFLSHQIHLIGSACCKAFIEVDNNCWPKVFPFDPFFPPLLKHHCENIAKDAPPSPTTLTHNPTVPSPSIVPDTQSPNVASPPLKVAHDESAPSPSAGLNI